MDDIKRIICPSCKCVLTAKYFKGIESKIFPCPKCGVKHKYTEYLPYPAQQDETDIGDVLRYRAANKQTPVQTDETELESVKSAVTIGCLKLPDEEELAQLKEGRNIIGRASSTSTATIQVKDTTRTMSRNHYYIDVLVYGSTVRHLLSVVPEAPNDTKLNGVKLEKTDKLVLNNGDIIRSGQAEVEFVLNKK